MGDTLGDTLRDPLAIELADLRRRTGAKWTRYGPDGARGSPRWTSRRLPACAPWSRHAWIAATWVPALPGGQRRAAGLRRASGGPGAERRPGPGPRAAERDERAAPRDPGLHRARRQGRGDDAGVPPLPRVVATLVESWWRSRSSTEASSTSTGCATSSGPAPACCSCAIRTTQRGTSSAGTSSRVPAIILDHDGWLVSDEVHAELTYRRPGTSRPRSTVRWGTGRSRSPTRRRPSTSPALRCAVATSGSADVHGRLGLDADMTLHVVGTLGIAATLAAWTPEGDKWVELCRQQLLRNPAHLERRLSDELPEAAWQPPQATYLAWLDLRRAGLGDDPAKWLLTTRTWRCHRATTRDARGRFRPAQLRHHHRGAGPRGHPHRRGGARPLRPWAGHRDPYDRGMGIEQVALEDINLSDFEFWLQPEDWRDGAFQTLAPSRRSTGARATSRRGRLPGRRAGILVAQPARGHLARQPEPAAVLQQPGRREHRRHARSSSPSSSAR